MLSTFDVVGRVICLMTLDGSAHYHIDPLADSDDCRRVSLHPRHGIASGSGCREMVGDMD